MSETPAEAYERGMDAGRIDQRLADYDRHFREINGSIAANAIAVRELTMQMQRLADQAIADGATRISTAEAVEKARQEAASSIETERRARVDRSNTAWSPIQKALAIVAGLAGLIITALAIRTATGK